MTAVDTLDTELTDDRAGAFVICMMDGAREFSVGYHNNDDVATTVVQSISDDRAVHARTANGTNMYIGTFKEFISPNVTVNFTTVQPTARTKAILFAIEDPSTQDVLLRRREEENY